MGDGDRGGGGGGEGVRDSICCCFHCSYGYFNFLAMKQRGIVAAVGCVRVCNICGVYTQWCVVWCGVVGLLRLKIQAKTSSNVRIGEHPGCKQVTSNRQDRSK
jgi:hypothetical protein